MSVRGTVVNNKGEKQWFDKPCFGFLSYINLWDESDDDDYWDDEDEDYEEEDTPLTGFESNQLSHFDWDVEPFQHMATPDAEQQKVWKAIREAMEGLPQYYKGWTVSDGDLESYADATITIPLTNEYFMQPTIIGGMMIRNICKYTSCYQSMARLLELGVDSKLAFILANVFFRSVGFGGSYWYLQTDGDESIFRGGARVCDVVAMYYGELGDNWQGKWGDTSNGYGRYGEYNGDTAPTSKRTKHQKELRDVTIITSGWDESEELSRLSRSNIYRTADDVMEASVLPTILNAIQEKAN